MPQVWNALTPIWKFIVAFGGSITTLAAVWKPAINVWRWNIDRYDSSVLELLRGRENVARRMSPFVVAEATPLSLMVKSLNRKGEKINKSLLRLEREDKVHREGISWQFGPTPLRPSADLERWK
jgi:hypothetical protein